MGDYIERETDDIKYELSEAAKDLGYPENFIDFTIEDEKTLKDEQGNIYKNYNVKFFVKEKQSPLSKIFSIGFDKTDNPKKAYIVVDMDKVKDDIEVDEDEIINEIKKLLALNKVVFGIKDNMLYAIAKEIKKRLSLKCKSFRILIAEGKQPVKGKNSELIYHFDRYKAAGTVLKNGTIDYRKKNFLIPVNKGTVLVEFLKPTKGKTGYSVFGKVETQDVGVVIDDIDEIKYDTESIERVEEDGKIKLISLKDGVIICQNDVYEVNDSVSLDKVDMKTTGNLDSDSSVDLEIGRGSDGVEDTIAAGMKVKGKKVVVNGDVGPKAVIEADEVDIKGSVHQSAFIKAKKAKIAICRGTVEADEVEIDLAEYAHITSKVQAVVNKAVSAKIYSPKIEIKDTMMSSNIVTSSESLNINDIEGSNNTIAVKPLSLPWIQEEYKELNVKLKYSKVLLKNQQKKYDAALMLFEKEKSKYEKIVETINALKKEKKTVPQALVAAIKKFKDLSDSLKHEKEKYKEIQSQFSEVEKNIDKLVNSYKNGHIIIKGRIGANNKILFDDTLSRILSKPQNNVKIYVRSINDKEEIVIDDNS